MLNKTRIKEIENRKIELIRAINLCNSYKDKIISFVHKLDYKHAKGLITREEYNNLLSTTLKHRTPAQWIEYYNSCIKQYIYQLEICERRLAEEKRANIVQIATLSILLIIMLGIGLFLIKPEITGLGVYEPSRLIDENISIAVSTLIPNSSTVVLTLADQHKVLSIAGLINETTTTINNITVFNITDIVISTKQFNIVSPIEPGIYNLTTRIIDNSIIIAENITEIIVAQKIINETKPINLTNRINITIELGIPPIEINNITNVTATLNQQTSTLPLSEFTVTESAVVIDLTKFDITAEEGDLNIKIISGNLILNETTIPLEILDANRIPSKPEISTKKIKTIDEIFNQTPFLDLPKEKVSSIKEIGFAGKEITLKGAEKKTLIIHQPVFDQGSFDKEVPLGEKDNFTYTATFEDTTLELEFDSREIKKDITGSKFRQEKNAGHSSWKIAYSYLLPSDKFKARLRISSSSPINIFDYHNGALETGKFNLDFKAERENGYNIEINKVSENIIYIYLSRDFAIEGKSINDTIILDPTLTIDATTVTLCAEVADYDKIEVVNRGVLAICTRTNATTGYANITLGNNGNFSLFANSNLEAAAAGAGGGAGGSLANTCSTQGEDGNLLVLGTTACTANGGGGSGADRAGNGDSIGGGGGAFGGGGGKGGYSAADVQSVGGNTYGSLTGVELLMGSGGGGEAGDITAGTGPGGPGGAGLKINASSGWINIYGNINLTGGNGTDGDATDDSGGGGGSGGHLILVARNLTLNNEARIIAMGASGGNAAGTTTSDSCGGGGGGGGRIHYYYETAIISNAFINMTTGGRKGAGTDSACDLDSDAGTSTGGSDGTIAHTITTFPPPLTADTDPPDWTSPQKNETLVYTGQFINFTATWNDDIALSSYIFSINQSGIWINSSSVAFSATPGMSANISIINATVGTVVQWRFFANDTTDNWNVTTTQTFVVSNTAPVIVAVDNVSIITPSITEASSTQFVFNFTVEDLDGVKTINSVTALGQINRTGETIRSNFSCLAKTNLSTTRTQFECTTQIWYFDAPGVWTINSSIKDTNGSQAINITSNITIRSTLAMVMGPSSLTWLTINVTALNTTASNNPIILNNTGNQNVSLGNVRVQALDLAGETTPTVLLNATNFTVGIATGANNPECAGTRLANNTIVGISRVGLISGNNSLAYNNFTSGQNTLYFCLAEVTAGVTQQSYSTRGAAWTISIV